MLKIIITGPECSGKTTLCKKLSAFYQKPFIKEYARTYLEENGPDYTFDDFKIIAKQQNSLILKKSFEDQKIMLSDTGLFVLKIWAEEKFGSCPDWIEESINDHLENTLYILCKPDMEWEADPLREDEDNREVLFDKYIQQLNDANATYMIAAGKMTHRLRESINMIRDIQIHQT